MRSATKAYRPPIESDRIPKEPGNRIRGKSSLPLDFLQQGARRIRGVALTFAGLWAFSWLLPLWIEGELGAEFINPFQWVPPTVGIVSSLVVYALSKSERLSAPKMVTVGLFYQVVVSFSLAFTQYWGTFNDIPAQYLEFDRIGLTVVPVWMLFFAILVPSQPRRALFALLASASATPITFVICARAGNGPTLEPSDFFFTLVFPYLICALGAYFGTIILYRLGKDLTRAREMGSYRLEARLGQGGMGEVWRAQHQMLARPAAIKLIRRDTVAGDPGSIDTVTRRFQREAQVTATLSSHHTVQLYDFGVTDDGTFYYVMELLEGLDLESLVRRFGPLSPARAVHLLLQVCHSLADAHHRDLIHRDIKPSNIYICRKGLDHDFVKVLDFGLVALRAEEPEDEARLTAQGHITGTPAYLAPEMAAGGEIDGRADIYALGCVAYWLLTGRLVFEAETSVAAILAHATKRPTPPSTVTELEIPPELEQVVLSCLEKKPVDRPQSAEDLADRLTKCGLAGRWSEVDSRTWWQVHL